MSKLGKKRWVKPELKRIAAGSAERFVDVQREIVELVDTGRRVERVQRLGEPLGTERVEADREPVEACLSQRLRKAAE